MTPAELSELKLARVLALADAAQIAWCMVEMGNTAAEIAEELRKQASEAQRFAREVGRG